MAYDAKSNHQKCSVKKTQVCNFRPATLLEKRLLAQVFSYGFCEIVKDNFFTEYLQATASMLKYMEMMYYMEPSIVLYRGELKKSYLNTQSFSSGASWY